jgi:hypothetical protein
VLAQRKTGLPGKSFPFLPASGDRVVLFIDPWVGQNWRGSALRRTSLEQMSS